MIDDIDFSVFETMTKEEVKCYIKKLETNADEKLRIVDVGLSIGVIKEPPFTVFDIASMYTQEEIDSEIKRDFTARAVQILIDNAKRFHDRR